MALHQINQQIIHNNNETMVGGETGAWRSTRTAADAIGDLEPPSSITAVAGAGVCSSIIRLIDEELLSMESEGAFYVKEGTDDLIEEKSMFGKQDGGISRTSGRVSSRLGLAASYQSIAPNRCSFYRTLTLF